MGSTEVLIWDPCPFGQPIILTIAHSYTSPNALQTEALVDQGAVVASIITNGRVPTSSSRHLKYLKMILVISKAWYIHIHIYTYIYICMYVNALIIK